MPSKYPELFEALAAPFPDSEVKQRSGSKGAKLRFITARTAANRLDEVLGPENWRDVYTETREGLKCRLWIRLPDGEWTWKEDGGGPAGMQATDDNEKSSFSDAFKRAAAKFGVARYLYRDGVPVFASTASTKSRKAAHTWHEVLERAVIKWDSFDPIRDSQDRRSREHRIAYHLTSAALYENLLTEDQVNKPTEEGQTPTRDPAKVWDAVKRLHTERPDWVIRALKAYLEDKEAAVRESAGQVIPARECVTG